MFLYMAIWHAARSAARVNAALFQFANTSYMIYYVLMIICWWRVFMKAGKNGFMAIIPFYDIVVMYRVALPAEHVKSVIIVFVCWLLYYARFPWEMVLITGVFALWAQLRFDVALAKSFGHKSIFALFIILLYPIAMLYLAFSPSVKYQGQPDEDELNLGIADKIGHEIRMISDPKYIEEYKKEQERMKKYDGDDAR